MSPKQEEPDQNGLWIYTQRAEFHIRQQIKREMIIPVLTNNV